MKKVFIIHGLDSSPESSWFPWLSGELNKRDIPNDVLIMPKPNAPVLSEWIAKISESVNSALDTEIYLVGHSLGVATTLNYLQSLEAKDISGAVLVSGRSKRDGAPKASENFYNDFDFGKIKSHCKKFSVIHGDNDPWVPVENAYMLADQFRIQPIIIENGEHLNGSAGWRQLPQVLEVLSKMMENETN